MSSMLVLRLQRRLVIGVLLALGIGALWPAAFASAEPLAPQAGPSCLYGASVMSQQDMTWLNPLNVGWYTNFNFQAFSPAGAAEFASVIRVQQLRNGCTRLSGYSTWPPLDHPLLRAEILSRPGFLWLIGNEPDRGPNPEDTTCKNRAQDDTAPEVYARAYHDIYYLIKGIDPTAKIANAGLVEVTPGRLQYLDIVWNTYRSLYGQDMPVDVWNMHIYILPEALPNGQPNGIANVAIGTDPALAIRESGNNPTRCAEAGVYCWAEHDDINAFSEQVVAMRRWMKNHGQQNKPLILSEYSVLYPYVFDNPNDPTSCYLRDEYGNCFSPQRVTNFLNASGQYLETAADPSLGYPHDQYRLVQRWAWFSVQIKTPGAVSNLADSTAGQLTLVGNAFANRAASVARPANLFVEATYGRLTILGSRATGDVLLTAEVRNQGTAPTAQPITVGFYRDAAMTDLIGTATVPAGFAGCGSQTVLAQKVWAGLPAGVHQFWVKVDADNGVNESQEDDNVAQGQVRVSQLGVWLPLIATRPAQ